LSHQTLQDAIWNMETILSLSPAHRNQVLLRIDGGFGTDESLKWLLHQEYQLCAKCFSGRRAGAWGSQVEQWQVLDPDRRWAALAPQQLHFCVPTRTLAVRWMNKDGQLKHALYVVTDLTSPIDQLCHLYDLRGGAEVDIREDKQGLLLTHRRKRAWNAQEVLVLLNDLAHNFIVAFRRVALTNTPLETYGLYRLIQNVFSIPGEAVVDEDHLVELRLLQSHPFAEVMADALRRFW
jgi:hypothetical protein